MLLRYVNLVGGVSLVIFVLVTRVCIYFCLISKLVLSQDSGGMLSLLDMIEQCLKVGKKQSWHRASVTNICVGLLAGLKVFIILCHHFSILYKVFLWLTFGPLFYFSGFACFTTSTIGIRYIKFSTSYFSGFDALHDSYFHYDNPRSHQHCALYFVSFYLFTLSEYFGGGGYLCITTQSCIRRSWSVSSPWK